MNKIIIHRSKSADTRSADHLVTRQELKEDTLSHISDVMKGMNEISSEIHQRALEHDWTKLDYFPEFFKQFHAAQLTGEWGEGWYDKIHITNERHHLRDNPPEDVDLIDVIEQIVDCVMAGLARSGEYRDESIPDELLQKAYKNTVKKLIDKIEVKQ